MKDVGLKVSVEHMFQSESTCQAVYLGARVEQLSCVLDTHISGLVLDSERMVIQSEPPNGVRMVILHAYDGRVDVLLPTAVFSIGLSAIDTYESAPESLNKETATSMGSYACLNGFGDETEYVRWENQQSDAAVMQLSASVMFSHSEDSQRAAIYPEGVITTRSMNRNHS